MNKNALIGDFWTEKVKERETSSKQRTYKGHSERKKEPPCCKSAKFARCCTTSSYSQC